MISFLKHLILILLFSFTYGLTFSQEIVPQTEPGITEEQTDQNEKKESSIWKDDSTATVIGATGIFNSASRYGAGIANGSNPDPNFPDPDAPFDDRLYILICAGIIYGIKKYKFYKS
ncbi:hypothetical protein BH09BAC2_BH09BAC2_16070 [soil metagenome]